MEKEIIAYYVLRYTYTFKGKLIAMPHKIYPLDNFNPDKSKGYILSKQMYGIHRRPEEAFNHYLTLVKPEYPYIHYFMDVDIMVDGTRHNFFKLLNETDHVKAYGRFTRLKNRLGEPFGGMLYMVMPLTKHDTIIASSQLRQGIDFFSFYRSARLD